jgi:hypothetical protein
MFVFKGEEFFAYFGGMVKNVGFREQAGQAEWQRFRSAFSSALRQQLDRVNLPGFGRS